MDIRPLAAVGARLEETVRSLPGLPSDPAELFDRYEEVSIQILDSECEDFVPGDEVAVEYEAVDEPLVERLERHIAGAEVVE